MYHQGAHAAHDRHAGLPTSFSAKETYYGKRGRASCGQRQTTQARLSHGLADRRDGRCPAVVRVIKRRGMTARPKDIRQPGQHALGRKPQQSKPNQIWQAQRARAAPRARAPRIGRTGKAARRRGQDCQNPAGRAVETGWHVSPKHKQLTASITGLHRVSTRQPSVAQRQSRAEPPASEVSSGPQSAAQDGCSETR